MTDTQKRESHSCQFLDDPTEYREYGAAIREVYEDEDGKLWASNGEYASRVNYCPFCNYEAKNKITEEDTL